MVNTLCTRHRPYRPQSASLSKGTGDFFKEMVLELKCIIWLLPMLDSDPIRFRWNFHKWVNYYRCDHNCHTYFSARLTLHATTTPLPIAQPGFARICCSVDGNQMCPCDQMAASISQCSVAKTINMWWMIMRFFKYHLPAAVSEIREMWTLCDKEGVLQSVLSSFLPHCQ